MSLHGSKCAVPRPSGKERAGPVIGPVTATNPFNWLFFLESAPYLTLEQAQSTMMEARLYSMPTPEQAASSEIQHFINRVQGKPGLQHIDDFWKLHQWSIDFPTDFWNEVWDWGGIIGEKGGQVFDPKPPMSSTGTRLPNSTLNYAENVLLSHASAQSDKIAIATVVEGTSGKPVTLESHSFKELYKTVVLVARKLRDMGIQPGDGVAAYTPSNSEAVVLMLATSAVGGVWSAVAAEAGPKAALERLHQTRPKLLLTADSVRYNGKQLDLSPKVAEVVRSLESFGLKYVVVVGQLGRSREPAEIPGHYAESPIIWLSWNELRKEDIRSRAATSFKFWRGPAMAPLWILFSSGTTGKPKAIVHHAGGMLLAQKMTNRLHHDVGASDVALQFTTCGWMMWQVAVSFVAMGATSIFYDGSPVVTPGVLWDIVDEHKCSYLGVSPRYLQIIQSAGFHPVKQHRLQCLKTLQVAGAPLSPELYDFIRNSIKAPLYLNNASGGTDICGSFVGSCPTLPVYYGEISAPILGCAIEAWNESGHKSVQGNLVCLKPFPNQPLGFLDDPQNTRYKETYFGDYPEVWNHSDWIEINPKTRGITMLGRSDGVLNPQGVRFGTAELYAVLEDLEDVEDCLAVGQKNAWRDERVVLFVKPKLGKKLDAAMVQRLKKEIASNLSKRHVPAVFVECPEIPYTQTLKRVEVAVKKLVNGAKLESINTSAIQNPDSLRFFVNHPQLRDGEVVKSKL